MAHPRAVSSVDPHRRLDSLVLDETLVFQLAYRANSCVSRPRKNSKVIAAHLTAKGKCAQHTDFILEGVYIVVLLSSVLVSRP